MEFEILTDVTTQIESIKIRALKLQCSDKLNLYRFGIDPGTVHLGLASIYINAISIYEITMPRQDTIVKRISTIQTLLTRYFQLMNHNSLGIIEGASYADRYRQTELAEVRTACAILFMNYNLDVIVVPPTAIRKNVFGNGRTKPDVVWSNLPPNAANALACAIYTN